MSDQEQVKKRGWVKNAAIIFLAIMLVLTLFSNTFLNRSLPEVAVQYAGSGAINTKIRGTGTIEANQSYEVSIQQTREVESVAVKVGDTVAPGDLLFTLSDTESDELETAKDELDALVLAYRLALIDASSSDYAQNNYEIQQLQAKLQQAQTECSQYYVSDAEFNDAKQDVSDIEAEIREINAELAELGGGSGQTGGDALETQLDKAEDELTAAEIAYREEMQLLREAAEEKREEDRENGSYTGDSVELYMAALAISFAGAGADEEWADSGVLKVDIANAYTAITKLEASVADLEEAIDNDVSDEYNALNRDLNEATAELEEAKVVLSDLEAKRTSWNTANENAESYQTQLNDKLFALSEQQKEDNKTQQKEALNLADQKSKISDLQQKVNELQAESVGTTVTAAAAGVITALNVTAGNSTMPGEPMAVIEVQDLGYSLSFPVTIEQAKRVKVGDAAEVSNYYWGSAIKATLSAIKNDPDNPGNGKLLQFRLDGEELSAGTQLTVSIGEKSANYDVLVPNSALHTDTNGSFVLVVTSKSTPLGNRYYANRVDVNVLATDDVNSAVSGGISSSDYVITTSTKPIESGQMVRLVEN